MLSRVVFSFSFLAPLLAACAAMRVSTYNLRFDSMPNNITVQESIASLPDPLQEPHFLSITTEQPWSTRRIRVAEYLLSEDVVVSGVHFVATSSIHDGG